MNHTNKHIKNVKLKKKHKGRDNEAGWEKKLASILRITLRQDMSAPPRLMQVRDINNNEDAGDQSMYRNTSPDSHTA